MAKLVVKRIKKAFDKGAAIGLGYTDIYSTEDGKEFATIYGGDLSSPSVVRFPGSVSIERAGGIFEKLPLDTEAWENKKRELLALPKKSEKCEYQDRAGNSYSWEDLTYHRYEEEGESQYLLDYGKGDYSLQTCILVKVGDMWADIIEAFASINGLEVVEEEDSYYNHSWTLALPGHNRGVCAAYESYSSGLWRHLVVGSPEILVSGELPDDWKAEMEKEAADEDKERAAAAAAKKKYAAEVFEEYYFLAGSIEGFPARKGVLDTMPSVRALNSLNKMVLAGFWLPAKIKAKVGKAYAWAYLEAVTPQPVYEALPNMTFTESQWVLENLPESK